MQTRLSANQRARTILVILQRILCQSHFEWSHQAFKQSFWKKAHLFRIHITNVCRQFEELWTNHWKLRIEKHYLLQHVEIKHVLLSVCLETFYSNYKPLFPPSRIYPNLKLLFKAQGAQLGFNLAWFRGCLYDTGMTFIPYVSFVPESS